MLLKSDLDNFNKNLHKDYEKAFNNANLKNKVLITEFKSNLKYVPLVAQEANLTTFDDVVIEKKNAQLVKVTLKDVLWKDDFEYVKEIRMFLSLLDYFELLIIHKDGSTQYYADIYTKKQIFDKFEETPLMTYKLSPHNHKTRSIHNN